MKRWIYIGMMAAIVASCGREKQPEQTAEAPQHARSAHLIDVQELHKRMQTQPDIQVIQVSKSEPFRFAHIPSAQRIYRPDYQQEIDGYGGMVANRDVIANLLGGLGVSSTERVYLYDEVGNPNAFRVWWLLRLYGHRDVVVVDGGLKAWTAAGYMTESGEAIERPITGYAFPNAQDFSLYASQQDVQTAVQEQGVLLLDTRSLDEFTGRRLKKGAAKAGRIPGSLHMDYIDALNRGGDHRLLEIDALRLKFEGLGAGPDTPIITYCQTGVRSALTTFVLTELLGFTNVKNYDGSWVEWSHKHLPIEIDSLNS